MILMFVLQMGQHRLPRLLSDFKPDWPTGLPLSDRRAINTNAIWGNVLRQQTDDITTAQFAVDCQVEQREIAGLVGKL